MLGGNFNESKRILEMKIRKLSGAAIASDRIVSPDRPRTIVIKMQMIAHAQTSSIPGIPSLLQPVRNLALNRCMITAVFGIYVLVCVSGVERPATADVHTLSRPLIGVRRIAHELEYSTRRTVKKNPDESLFSLRTRSIIR